MVQLPPPPPFGELVLKHMQILKQQSVFWLCMLWIKETWYMVFLGFNLYSCQVLLQLYYTHFLLMFDIFIDLLEYVYVFTGG